MFVNMEITTNITWMGKSINGGLQIMVEFRFKMPWNSGYPGRLLVDVCAIARHSATLNRQLPSGKLT